VSATRPRGRPRGLSRRRVRAIVTLDQRWQDTDGRSWTIRGVHRKDGLVRLERSDGAGFAFVAFGKLGKSYRLEGER